MESCSKPEIPSSPLYPRFYQRTFPTAPDATNRLQISLPHQLFSLPAVANLPFFQSLQDPPLSSQLCSYHDPTSTASCNQNCYADAHLPQDNLPKRIRSNKYLADHRNYNYECLRQLQPSLVQLESCQPLSQVLLQPFSPLTEEGSESPGLATSASKHAS